MMEFADEGEVGRVASPPVDSWKILIVDDEPDIHSITRLALEEFIFDRKKLEILSAYSGVEARRTMTEHPDIALILLDVIMETDEAGLVTAKYIRETLQNRATRIVLRTGQPGQVPERQAILDYDIDDYKTKAEFTAQKLFTTIVTGLRTYKAYTAITALNTDLQNTNAELMRLARLKDEFLATIGHELRTPLNAILGMSECLLAEAFGAINPHQLEAIDTINHSGNHLLELIQDILDISNIMAGMLKLEVESVAIADLCTSSLEFVKQKALKKRIQLSVVLSPEIDSIAVDKRRMRQVLINLLDNAIKFTPPDGKVSLDASMCNAQINDAAVGSDSWIQLSVTDTGIGIAPSDREKLFQPFIQLDSGLNRRFGGSGIGLALVKQIVELHGGFIDLNSQVGQGSCFSVRLPYHHRNSLD